MIPVCDCFHIPVMIRTITVFAFFLEVLLFLYSASSFSTLPHVRKASEISSCFRKPSFILFGNALWNALKTEEDDEPRWYLLSCTATEEFDLLYQCQTTGKDHPDIFKFVVPTTNSTRSHGAHKMVTEQKVKYPGYVFAKVRLCPDVYEKILQLGLCRAWMGTNNRKGKRQLPSVPQPLGEEEVGKFELEEWGNVQGGMSQMSDKDSRSVPIVGTDGDSMASKIDSKALAAFLGLQVNDAIKVTAQGRFHGEDGIIRRLKDGKIMVRFFTYGALYDDWLNPGDVRKLSKAEKLQGLTGPMEPITQQTIDGSLKGEFGRSFWTHRNRRQDRVEDQVKRQDLDDEERNTKNWKWYQDHHQQVPVDRGAKCFNSGDNRSVERQTHHSRERDLDLGSSDERIRQPLHEQHQTDSRNVSFVFKSDSEHDSDTQNTGAMEDWSSFVSKSKPSEDSQELENAFFATLIDDVSSELQQVSPEESDNTSTDASESTFVDRGTLNCATQSFASTSTTADNDRFITSLEEELERALDDGEDRADEFISTLEARIAEEFGLSVDDLEGSGEGALTSLDCGTPSKSTTKKKIRINLTSTSAIDEASLLSVTVPVLKEMLRERGLKVTGKKSELIERLLKS